MSDCPLGDPVDAPDAPYPLVFETDEVADADVELLGGQLVRGDQVVVDSRVPEDLLPRLFERLFRVESSRSRDRGGAGLGLALCRTIVEAHAGTITAQPSPLGGLWIAITFPWAT